MYYQYGAVRTCIFMREKCFMSSTKHMDRVYCYSQASVSSVLAHRLRRWANTEQTSGQCRVAGLPSATMAKKQTWDERLVMFMLLH